MYYYFRYCLGCFLGILLFGLYGWVSSSPVYAHHDAAYTKADLSLQPNFIVRTVASGLNLPTDMVVLPSGDLLVTEKGVGGGVVSRAEVRWVRNGILQPAPVLTLQVNTLEDSGLMSILLDPQFSANHYFYLWYSTGEGSVGWNGTSYNRLSRFVFDPLTGTTDAASETIIIDKVPWANVHNGGGLAFDGQGNLLIATGDVGTGYSFPSANLAQSLKSLSGKVLRIRPLAEGGYTVPPDNPYVGNSAGYLPEIYASGLRNPFRLVQRPGTQEFYVTDVGQETWEEVNLLKAGANYGWPYREGPCPIFQRDVNCPGPGETFTDPLVAYTHPPGRGGGITGITFYNGNTWPVGFRGQLFFADFDSDLVSSVNLSIPSIITLFASGLGAVVDMEATEDGIYVLSIYDQSIKFIFYDEEGNNPPTVTWNVTPTIGKAPLSVRFTANATDAENDEMMYRWNFGDGVSTTTPLPGATHVYTRDGNYLATLQVIDENDGKSEILSRVIQVYSGELPTIVQENLTEPGRTLYHGGDQIQFRATRDIGVDDLDADAPYEWSVLLHHNDHAHILMSGFVSDTVLLDIPTETHALDMYLWYEVQLTMRTASGQTLLTNYELRPQTTSIQLQSWPGPTFLTVNQQAKSPSQTTLAIVGQTYTIEAPQAIVHNGRVGFFKNWVVTPSWPVVNIANLNENWNEIENEIENETEKVTDRVYTFRATDEAVTYIAFYEYLTTANIVLLPSIRR